MKKSVLMLLANEFKSEGFLDNRVYKEAQTLIQNGYPVTIICMDRKNGSKRKERIDGIEVVRIRVGKIKAGKMISVAKGLLRYYHKATRIIRKLHKKKGFVIVHAHDFDTMLLGTKLKKTYNLPLIYDLHDLYESFVSQKTIKKMIHLLDMRFYKKADKILIVNDSFKRLPGIKKSKTTTIMNTPTKKGSKRMKQTSEGLIYAGGLNKQRDLTYVLKTIKNQKITIAGDGPLYQTYKKIKGRNIWLLGRISPKEVDERTRKSLAILALYDTKYPNNQLASPNKLFDAMKYGKPVIVSKHTVMGTIVEETGCGVTVEYGNQKEIQEAITQVNEAYTDMSTKSLEAFRNKYNWERMEEKLLETYRELTT